MFEAYKKIYYGYLWKLGQHILVSEYYLAGGWIALITVNFFIGLFKKIMV